MGASAWRVQFVVPPGSYLMRTVVREPGGLAGSADRRIDVRALDGPEIGVSDLVIGSSFAALPVQPRAYTGEGLSGVLETYARSAVQMEGLNVRIELRTPGAATVRNVQAELLDPQEDAAGLNRRVRFTMSLEGLEPGAYTAHAIVRSRGETVAERTRQVQILDARSGIPTEGDPAVPFERVTPLDVVTGDLAPQIYRLVADPRQGRGGSRSRETGRARPVGAGRSTAAAHRRRPHRRSTGAPGSGVVRP